MLFLRCLAFAIVGKKLAPINVVAPARKPSSRISRLLNIFLVMVLVIIIFRVENAIG